MPAHWWVELRRLVGRAVSQGAVSSAGPKAACQLTGGALSPRGLFGPRLPALGLQAVGWCLVLALTGQDVSPAAQQLCSRAECPPVYLPPASVSPG